MEPYDQLEIEHRMATVLPEGWQATQLKPEQPTTQHAEFTRVVLNEIARSLNVPFNIAYGNSSGYNYSSGRLDHQTYYKQLRVEQDHIERVILNPLFEAWLAEAVLVEGLLPQSFRTGRTPPRQWFWDGQGHIDPLKEANAQAARLASNTTTLAAEYARQGLDWEAELRQRAKEMALIRELGLPMTPAPTPAAPEPADENENEDTADEKQKATPPAHRAGRRAGQQ